MGSTTSVDDIRRGGGILDPAGNRTQNTPSSSP